MNLTRQQIEALRRGEPIRVSPSEVGEEVVVIRASAFDELRELLEDEQEKRAWARLGLDAAGRWAEENAY